MNPRSFLSWNYRNRKKRTLVHFFRWNSHFECSRQIFRNVAFCWMRSCEILCRIKICLCVLDGWSVANKAPSFIYLIIPSHVCTCKRADHRRPRATGSPDPWSMTPSSAGQTLTPEQMDNGPDALSALDHTLLLPAFSTAAAFTFFCPPCLSLHLSHPAPDWLRSQNHLSFTFCRFFFFYFYNSISSTSLQQQSLFNHIIFFMYPPSFRCSSDLSALF